MSLIQINIKKKSLHLNFPFIVQLLHNTRGITNRNMSFSLKVFDSHFYPVMVQNSHTRVRDHLHDRNINTNKFLDIYIVEHSAIFLLNHLYKNLSFFLATQIRFQMKTTKQYSKFVGKSPGNSFSLAGLDIRLFCASQQELVPIKKVSRIKGGLEILKQK